MFLETPIIRLDSAISGFFELIDNVQTARDGAILRRVTDGVCWKTDAPKAL
jgi:hypothetical protein